MLKRIVGVSMLTFALACASSGPDGGGGPFGAEAPMGMDERGGLGAVPASTGDLQTIYFDYDRDALRAEAKATLRSNADTLRAAGGMRIEIQGNCDARGSEEYNLALGMRRAETARRYIMDLGIDGSRLSTISFGEENPAVRGRNESAWAKNRRDDFVIR